MENKIIKIIAGIPEKDWERNYYKDNVWFETKFRQQLISVTSSDAYKANLAVNGEFISSNEDVLEILDKILRYNKPVLAEERDRKIIEIYDNLTNKYGK